MLRGRYIWLDDVVGAVGIEPDRDPNFFNEKDDTVAGIVITLRHIIVVKTAMVSAALC